MKVCIWPDCTDKQVIVLKVIIEGLGQLALPLCEFHARQYKESNPELLEPIQEFDA